MKEFRFKCTVIFVHTQVKPFSLSMPPVVPQIGNTLENGVQLTSDSGVVMCPSDLPEYTLECLNTTIGHRSHQFTLRLILRRRSLYHIWTTYLPSVLLLSLGCVLRSESLLILPCNNLFLPPNWLFNFGGHQPRLKNPKIVTNSNLTSLLPIILPKVPSL